VVFTGRLSDADLVGVMASAHALCYVPYFEGFGIPILEAFACHVPVIASDCTSMPEVAGDAAMLVDPFSVEDIAQAMQQLAGDRDLCLDLVSKGRDRISRFSWDRSSLAFWESIMKSSADNQ
jgi:glycosyltransferase involved in cell wall biosynthesis